MKQYDVVFRPAAEADLFQLYEHIAAASGRAVAGDYIGRIETVCLSLATFPQRGTRRDRVRPGLRTIGFERRATIAFDVEAGRVVIARIFYGGQDFESRLGEPGPE